MNADVSLARRVARLPILRTVVAWRDERRFSTRDNANLNRGVYATYSAAAAAVPPDKPVGYDHDAPALMYEDRVAAPGPSDYPVLLWLDKLVPEHRSLFDLGGHVGVSYYASRPYVPLPDGFTWVVCDVPAVVARGRYLAAARGVTDLRFTDQPSECVEHGLLLASGSLQYLERSLAEILKDADAHPTHLIVNLTPYQDDEGFWTVQNIGTAYCPYHVQSRRRFVADLERLGYRVLDRWRNPDKQCVIVGDPEHSVFGYDGFVFEKT